MKKCLPIILFVAGVSNSQLGHAQVIQATSATTPPPAQTNVAPLAAAPSAQMREIFQRRSANIRQHHRPTPLQPIPPAAFTRSLEEAPPPPQATSVNPPTLAAAPGGISVQIVTNHALADVETNNFTSVVSEPSVAARGNEVLFTANWFAAFSTNGGQSFAYMDPAASFPTPPSELFCCDQLAYYDRSRDLMIWVLQYIHPDTQGTNRLRVAVARGADISARAWRFYDFTPQDIGGWTAEWFDFPAMAAGSNHLYLTTNSFGFGASGGFTRAVLLRLPLDQLANYQGLDYHFMATSEVGSLRPVLGAATTGYIAAHRSPNRLRIYEWPDSGANLTIREIGVAPWSLNATSIPGTEWLGRSDPRITAGWFAGNRVGVAWTAGRDSTFPHGHIRVARIDPGSWTIVDQPHIWSSTIPFAYPVAAPNGAGQIGIGLAYATTAGLFPSHAVGVRDDAANVWRFVFSAEGTAAPSRGVWGDYFTMGLHGQNANEWVTAGFTLNEGTENEDVIPRYVHFRLSGEPQVAAERPTTGAATPAPATASGN